jgi:hypothetical protein
MVELFAEIPLLRNDGIFAATDFELVAVWIFEKEGVIARAIAAADFRPFQILASDVTNQSCDFIDFITRFCPKSDSRAVRLMLSIFSEAEKLRQLVFADWVKRPPRLVRPIAGKPKLGQKLLVKSHRPLKILYSQINVIQPSGFHFAIVDFRICGEPISFDAAPGFIGRAGFYISESQRQRNIGFRISGYVGRHACVGHTNRKRAGKVLVVAILRRR